MVTLFLSPLDLQHALQSHNRPRINMDLTVESIILIRI